MWINQSKLGLETLYLYDIDICKRYVFLSINDRDRAIVMCKTDPPGHRFKRSKKKGII